MVGKLDESKVRWIIQQKRKGCRNKEIADAMSVSVRWVQAVWARYKGRPTITYPLQMGRPANSLPGRREHSAVISVKTEQHAGARHLEKNIESDTGIHIPHNIIHRIMIENDLAAEEKKKKCRRKWIRYEREHSNSMWHTDYKQLDNRRQFIA